MHVWKVRVDVAFANHVDVTVSVYEQHLLPGLHHFLVLVESDLPHAVVIHERHQPAVHEFHHRGEAQMLRAAWQCDLPVRKQRLDGRRRPLVFAQRDQALVGQQQQSAKFPLRNRGESFALLKNQALG